MVDGSEDLLLVTQSGTLIRMDVDEIKLMSRSTQGVIVMRFKDGDDRVIALSLAEKEAEISEKGSEEVLAPDAPSSEGQKEETAGED